MIAKRTIIRSVSKTFCIFCGLCSQFKGFFRKERFYLEVADDVKWSHPIPALDGHISTSGNEHSSYLVFITPKGMMKWCQPSRITLIHICSQGNELFHLSSLSLYCRTVNSELECIIEHWLCFIIYRTRNFICTICWQSRFSGDC